ncbi:hypothetical protein ABZU25_19460 [Micromonospora sp. NPDC005215]|uniref:hypothetical protein n=1 Tax=Micromonospora sp. NPDC005215 TaxID=3157024 RepID=UPI0033B90B40
MSNQLVNGRASRQYATMRIADVEVGVEYAHRKSSWSPDASRVVVREKITGGRLRVEVLEPAADTENTFRRGSRVEVRSRSILCTWEVWPELSAAEQETRDKEAAEKRERWAEIEQQEIADPTRPISDKYDTRYYSSLVDSTEHLRDWPLPEPRFAWRPVQQQLKAAALRTLEGLPVYLARDLLAGATLWSDDSSSSVVTPDGSAGAVLGPLAPTLTETMDWANRGYLARRIPDDLLSAASGFVEACAAAITKEGGHLELPEVPQLDPIHFSGPGWMRISYGYSSGRRIHAPDCHVLQSQKTDPNKAATWPAWRLNLPGSDPCGNCEGPWMAASPALLGFFAAIAIWRHRSDKSLERWQLRACLMMLADAARARAIEVEPDRDWVHRVVSALVVGRPGENGWDAYTALKQMGGDSRTWDSARQMSALRLAYDRLTILHDALPLSLRPADQPEPQPTENLSVEAELRRTGIQSWYHSLSQVCTDKLPDLDLLLFGLPGAIKW